MQVRAAKTAQAGLHICQVPGCTLAISRRHLMCAAHWFEVPMPIRTEVFKTLAGWLNGEDSARPYLIARLAAIIAVATLHKLDVAEQEAARERLLATFNPFNAHGNAGE
jgi:hypothetical protein